MTEPTPAQPETHSAPPASAGASAVDAVATLPPSPAGQRPQHLTPTAVTELVLRWQEAWQRGQPIDTAELCAGTPELRDEVRRHLEALRAMEALLDRLPAADSAATVPPGPGGDARQTLAQDSVATAAGVQVPGYEILEELGRGGMGVVYKARHIKLNRAVALKMVLAGGHAGSEDRIRFLAEAEAVAALQHANIVQVFEVGQHDSLPFMALEYVNGGSLADRLRDGLPLPREAAWLVQQLAHGMAAAHAKGIIHRDLKPHNVLLRRRSEIQNPKSEKECGLPGSDFGFRISDLEPKITDFGLAKKVEGGSGLTQTGAVMGTPSYMAPEQAEAKKDVGPAADIYALGAILYECLTGRPPFRGATPLDTIMQVVAEEPVSVRQLQPSCPRDLKTMCLKCLRKEPGKRYGSATELAEDLRRWQAGEPITARPVGRLERAVKWTRRNPALAALGAALLLGAVVSSFFAVAASRQAELAAVNEQRASINEQRALHKEAEAVAANQGLEAKTDELEGTLARSLLRPLGLQPWRTDRHSRPLLGPELDALVELAGSKSEGFPVRFVTEALRRPATRRQLRLAGEPALHAAVGLDSRRREQAEQRLRTALTDPQANGADRLDLALLAVDLGPLAPEMARAAVPGLARAVAIADPADRTDMLDALTASIRRLPPVEAVVLLEAALPKAGSATSLAALADLVHSTAGRLPPETAAAVNGRTARILLQAVESPQELADLRLLSQTLTVTAGSLPSADTAVLGQRLARACASAKSPQAQCLLADCFSQLPGPRQAGTTTKVVASLCRSLAAPNDFQVQNSLRQGLSLLATQESGLVAAALTQAMTKTTEPNALNSLASSLGQVAARLEPKAAAEVATTLSQALTKTTQSDALTSLAWSLGQVAARLELKAAAEVATTLSQAMTTTTAPNALSSLASSLGQVAARLEAKEAAQVATTLSQAMTKTTEPFALGNLASSLGQVATRLEAKDVAQVATTLGQALTKTTEPFALGNLASSLGQVAAQLEAKDVAQVATTLGQALTKTTEPNSLSDLASSLAQLAARLQPKEAAQVCTQAAATLTQAMSKTTEPLALSNLASSLGQLAARLEPKEAAQVCTPAAASLTQAMTKTTEPNALMYLARGQAG